MWLVEAHDPSEDRACPCIIPHPCCRPSAGPTREMALSLHPVEAGRCGHGRRHALLDRGPGPADRTVGAHDPVLLRPRCAGADQPEPRRLPPLRPGRAGPTRSPTRSSAAQASRRCGDCCWPTAPTSSPPQPVRRDAPGPAVGPADGRRRRAAHGDRAGHAGRLWVGGACGHPRGRCLRAAIGSGGRDSWVTVSRRISFGGRPETGRLELVDPPLLERMDRDGVESNASRPCCTQGSALALVQAVKQLPPSRCPVSPWPMTGGCSPGSSWSGGCRR
jgi:hypothetical protein